MISILKTTLSRFSQDDCLTLAASLSYYTVFALPPLLYLLLTIVTLGMSVVYEREEAHQKAQALIERQAAELIGNRMATDEITMILEQNLQQGGVWWKSLISIGAIIFGATGVMAAIQASLNRIWRVRPDPQKGRLKKYVIKRLLSLGLILGLGFLLLVSMFISALFAAVGSQLSQWLGFEASLASSMNYAVVFLGTFVVFAALFKLTPDAKIGWRNVWVGALVTAVLFSLGRYAMEFYFAFAHPAARLGSTAASIAVLLVWIYYSSIIFLIGAEFTQAWATKYGRGIEPEPGVLRVEERLIRDRQPST